MNQKIITVFFFFIGLSFWTNAQIVPIPNANFKTSLVNNGAINTNGDTEIQVSEATAYSGQIILFEQDITDLSGLEYFTNLNELMVQDTLLSGTLDLTPNAQLTTVVVNFSEVTSIDISQNPLITILAVNHNNLTSLDLSGNPALTTLVAMENEITSLDLSQNPALINLNLQNNLLNTLDISQNPNVSSLDVSGNDLNTLVVANGNNSGLQTMIATNNPNLSCIEHDGGFFPSTLSSWYDWQKDGAANYSSSCGTCNIFVPDVAFKNWLLAQPNINTNGDGEIQCGEATSFSGEMNCGNSGITNLTGIEEFPGLTKINLDFNPIDSLDFSSNLLLDTLDCAGTGTLEYLNVTANASLLWLNCQSGLLSELDLSGCTQLKQLYCQNNQFTSLSLQASIELAALAQNDLTSVSIPATSNLKFLTVFENNLAQLDVSNALQLESLDAEFNSLVALDLSNNPALVSIQLYNNQLTQLNLANGNNSLLTYAELQNNPDLTCIQIDAGFSPPVWDPVNFEGWNKDSGASYNMDCGYTNDISEFEFESMLYPNPTNGVVTIKGHVEMVEVKTLTGETIEIFTGCSVDITSYPSGIYLFQIDSGTERKITRVVKK